MGVKGSTKNSGRKDPHDRFYTEASEAERLVLLMLTKHPEYVHGRFFVEPSAGNGSFVKALEEHCLPVLAYDLIPAEKQVCQSEIKKQDFLDLDRNMLREDGSCQGDASNFIFVGNPPFGVQGDLSVAFINHCFELGAEAVWFILPPTFRKESYLSKLPHAQISDVYALENVVYDLPDGEQRTVPSCFIGFDYVESKPAPIPTSQMLGQLPFEFCSKSEAQFCIRRVGGTAGIARLDTGLSEQSNYFCRLRANCGYTVEQLIEEISALEFPERDWTVGPRSVSKREIARGWLESHSVGRTIAQSDCN